MKIVARIECGEDLKIKDDAAPELLKLVKTIDKEGTVAPRVASGGKAHTLDPGTLELLLTFSGSTVAAAAINGVVKYFVERAKGTKNTIKLTIKKTKIEVSGNTSPKKVAAYVKEIKDALGEDA